MLHNRPRVTPIARAAADKTVMLWNAAKGHSEGILEGHTQGLSDVAWSPDSKLICTASDDKHLKLWDVASVRSPP